MNFSTNFVLAQAAPGAAGGGFSFVIVMILMLGFMYFAMLRPQMKRQKEHRDLVAGLAKGDEVVTNGGIAGRIDDVGENFVSVEIAPNIKIKVQKSAVQQVLPKGSLKSS
jgi:preprotein translocase subunit YajC